MCHYATRVLLYFLIELFYRSFPPTAVKHDVIGQHDEIAQQTQQTMSSPSLPPALTKLQLASVEDARFQDLPAVRNDPLWNDILTTIGLDLFELGALKNARCDPLPHHPRGSCTIDGPKRLSSAVVIDEKQLIGGEDRRAQREEVENHLGGRRGRLFAALPRTARGHRLRDRRDAHALRP